MIELDLTEEQQSVRELARSLASDLLAPAGGAAERQGDVPGTVWDALHDSGLTTPVPVAYGGGGVPDCLTQLVATEELAGGDPGISVAAVWAGGVSLLVAGCGTPRQQEDHFSSIGSRRQGGVALYEGFGRSPSELRTSLTAAADGWSVVGAKVAVPFAEGTGDRVVVGNDGTGRLRAVLLPAGHEGVRIAPGPQDGWLALGPARLRSVAFDLTVGADSLLGGPGADDAALVLGVSRLRLLPAAVALGCARRAVEYAADYANERQAFGRAISSFQGVSFLMAEAAIRISAARLELWDIAARLDAGAGAPHAAVSRAVDHACTIAAESARDALQVLGGHGFITDHPVERWYRSTAALSTIDADVACGTFAAAL